jgi:hypothetical protein
MKYLFFILISINIYSQSNGYNTIVNTELNTVSDRMTILDSQFVSGDPISEGTLNKKFNALNKSIKILKNSVSTGLNLKSMVSFNFSHENINSTQITADEINFKFDNIYQNILFFKNELCNNSKNRISSEECQDLELNLNNYMNRNLINLSQYPNAKCNDGTPASFFIRPGYGSGSNRWIIHLEEGGVCGRVSIGYVLGQYVYANTCPDRAVSYPQYVGTSGDPIGYRYPKGILSAEKSENPDFYSWNHVEIRYCSSDLWSGSNSQNISSSTWHFKGRDIINAVFNELINNHNLNQADNVILSGASAGGWGILSQGDHIKNNFLNTIDVSLLSDSGFLSSFDNIFGTTNPDELLVHNHDYWGSLVDSNCNLSDQWKCHVGKYNKNYISTPLFVIQDQFDDFYAQFGNAGLFNKCSGNPSDELWLNNYATDLRNNLSINVFSPRKGQHVYLNNSYWLNNTVGDSSSRKIFRNWYFNNSEESQSLIDMGLPNYNQEIQDLCL